MDTSERIEWWFRRGALLAAATVVIGLEMRRPGAEHGSDRAQAAQIPELSDADPFTGRGLSYTQRQDGSLELALDGAVELLEGLVPARSASTLVPLVLPSP